MKGIILDVETTGIDYDDEVIEISISDIDGNILFFSRIKPTVKISAGARRLHEITDEMLRDEPTIRQVLRRLKRVVMDADKIYCWSSDFVINKLLRTARAMNADARVFSYIRKHVVDLRDIVAQPDEIWPRMDHIVHKYGIEWDGKKYSSINDCKVISKLIKALARDEDVYYTFE